MAKGMYVGVNHVARKVKKAYVGVNGVARKVKKIYIGVNGVARLCFGALTAYQKYAWTDILKPKYSPSHGLYVAHKNTSMGDGGTTLQPYYSTDLINWTRFTNVYYENASSWGGGMGEVFPFKDKIFVKGSYNGSWNYAGRNYLFRYDSPTSAYAQIAQATSDGSIYPLIDHGFGFYTSYTGQSGAKVSLAANDPLTWVGVTYRAGGIGGISSDGFALKVNGDATHELQLAEINLNTKTELLRYVGGGLSYRGFTTYFNDTFFNIGSKKYWGYYGGGNGLFVQYEAPIFQVNIPAPIKMAKYSSQLGVVLAVDINNKVYECPTNDLNASSVFTLVDANLGTTINSIAVGNNEFIVQSNLGIFVLR